jgi:Phycobilisome protein
MNSILEKHIRQADGRYFTDLELGLLEEYVQSYELRLATYSVLCERSEMFVEQTLAQLSKTDRATVQEFGDKCRRDMSYVLRSIAIAILKDDDDTFREQFILWMQNIMTALRKEAQSARAYVLLQEIISQQLPDEQAALVNRNLHDFVQALNVSLQAASV